MPHDSASALRIFPDDYVPNAEGAEYHRRWVKANPAEATKWEKFRDDVIARKQIVPPSMATKYGKALVAAGKEHMSISHFVGQMENPYPPADPPPPPPPPPPGGSEYGTINNPWGATSPFRTSAIGRAAHASSAAFISNLYNNITGINVNKQFFTVSLWTPANHAFSTTQWFAPDELWYLDNVYHPTTYVDDFDVNRENHAVFFDVANNRVASFYNATNSRTYRTGVFHKLDGSGWWPNSPEGVWGARASGAAANGGLITRYDLTQPTIDHALACCIPTSLSRSGVYVSPATTSDGQGVDAVDLPMGACIVLDSQVNLDTNPAYSIYSPVEKKMLRAIQSYGLYVVDSSSSMAIYSQHQTYGDQGGTGGTGYPPSPMSSRNWLLDSYVAVAYPHPFQYDTKALHGGQPHR